MNLPATNPMIHSAICYHEQVKLKSRLKTVRDSLHGRVN